VGPDTWRAAQTVFDFHRLGGELADGQDFDAGIVELLIL
jgi:hypothetical protein